MFSENPAIGDNLEVFKTQLKDNYRKIEERATDIIKVGEAVDNPTLVGDKVDKRYSISTVGFVTGTEEEFLNTVIMNLQASERLAAVPPGFLHVTFRELIFSPVGRRGKEIDAIAARAYYQALRNQFEDPGEQINFELYRVLPAIDKEQNSVAIVGAFLPLDTRIIQIRRQINEAVENNGLALEGRLGDIRVLFTTLGRLPHPPQRADDNSFPLFSTLAEINRQIPLGLKTEIRDIQVLSTSPGSYADTRRHIYLMPPISLVQGNPLVEARFVRAAQKNAHKE